jgi:hypothetical protein
MGKLIKHQWARLIALTAGGCNVPHFERLLIEDLAWAAFWGFFYPKAFLDMFTPYHPLPLDALPLTS